jgi:glycosyltransferase involved in cell wall biosynthesis
MYPHEKQLSTAVVICTLNRPDDILRAVQSLCKQTVIPNQLVVVDAGDLGDVATALEEIASTASIAFDYCKASPSTTRQRNLGADRVHSDIVFFMDDDIDLDPAYIEIIRGVYQEDSAGSIAGIAGVDQSVPEVTESLQLYRKLFMLREERADGFPRLKRSNFPILVPHPSRRVLCEVLPSTAVSYRKAVFNQHRFDDELDGYVMAEDIDLSYRVSREFKLCVTPDAHFNHHRSKISRASVREREMRRVYFTQYFFKKNQGSSLLSFVARCWALIGLGLLYAQRSATRRNLELIAGFLDGIALCRQRQLLGPGSLRRATGGYYSLQRGLEH